MEPSKKLENLDRIMRAEEELAPSSGFVSSVMERVREEAAAPKPIPFPWKRVVPGMVLAIGGVAWIAVQVARQGPTRLPDTGSLAVLWAHMSPQMTGELESTGWVAAALVLSLMSWLLARRCAC